LKGVLHTLDDFELKEFVETGLQALEAYLANQAAFLEFLERR